MHQQRHNVIKGNKHLQVPIDLVISCIIRFSYMKDEANIIIPSTVLMLSHFTKTSYGPLIMRMAVDSDDRLCAITWNTHKLPGKFHQPGRFMCDVTRFSWRFDPRRQNINKSLQVHYSFSYLFFFYFHHVYQIWREKASHGYWWRRIVQDTKSRTQHHEVKNGVIWWWRLSWSIFLPMDIGNLICAFYQSCFFCICLILLTSESPLLYYEYRWCWWMWRLLGLILPMPNWVVLNKISDWHLYNIAGVYLLSMLVWFFLNYHPA